MAWRCSGATNEELIDNLAKANIIKSEIIKNTFKRVDRGNYAPSNPYQDGPQGIGYQVTISAPHMHANAIEYLQNQVIKDGSKVLDIGCGSGYLSAVMSRLNPSATVFGIDYIPQLVELSINNVQKSDNDLLLSKKVQFVVGDGWNGLESSGPFDAIHVGAAAAKIPLPLVKQLKVGGRIFIPVGDQGEPQSIVIIDKLKEGITDDCFKLQPVMGVRFGPLVKHPSKDTVKISMIEHFIKPDDILEASFHGDVAAVNLLIRNSSNVNVKCFGQDTSLILAAFNGHLPIVQILLSLAANVYKPIMPQVRYNGAGFVSPLRKVNDLIGGIKNYCGRNLGVVAIPGSNGRCGPSNGPQCSDCSSIVLLNGAGFPLKPGTVEGISTLYCARRLGRDAIPGSDGQCGPNNGPQCSDCSKFQSNEVKNGEILCDVTPISRNELELIASCQLDVDAIGYEGNTALINAAQRGHAEVVAALVQANCNISIKNKHGKTALMYASKKGTEAAVKSLLTKVSDLNLADTDGKTAFIHACENGFIDIALMLARTGKVDSTMKSSEGKTGLDYISASDKKRTVQDCIAAVALKNQPYRYHIDNFITCDKDHSMKRSSGTPPSYSSGGGISCDLCKRNQLQEDPFYYNCETCNYDVCMNCCTSVREKQVAENERKKEELKRQEEDAENERKKEELKRQEEEAALAKQRNAEEGAPLSPEKLASIEELRRFLTTECDINEVKAKGLADALVINDDLTNIKRLKIMHSKGKLQPILVKYKPALLSDVDEEIIVDKLNESVATSLVSGLASLSTSSGTTCGASSPTKSHIKDIKWSGLEILEVVGKGSYSVVVKARYEIELVAVKVLLCNNGFNNTSTYDELCSSAGLEASLISDAERRVTNPESIVHVVGICQGIIPPNISSTFGISTGAAAVGIVMRYEGGGSLESLLHPPTLTAKRNLNITEKISILMGIARGLTELHDIDIVHGDIKPGNILLSHHMPPLVRLADFGQSEQRDQSLVDTLGNSVLSQTSTRKGTPVYAAPELLPNLPSDDSDEDDMHVATTSSGSTSSVSKITRRSDMYAFAMLAWELLNKKGLKPFHTCKDEIALIYKVQKDKRPSIDDLVVDCPSIIKDMIVCCWDRDRNKRLSALECFTRLNHVYFVLMKANFDIFFSHPWINKNVLQHVKYYLTNAGYRVWYDQEEMGYDLVKSMQDGIMHSKVVLVCLNKLYENSRACMYELTESTKAIKPILTLVTESSPFAWAGQNTVHGNVRSLCQLDTKMFVDISSTCSKKGWDEYPVPPDLLEELKRGCESLIKCLQDPTINCLPSF